MAAPLPLVLLLSLVFQQFAPPIWADGGGSLLEASMHSLLWDAHEGERPSIQVTPNVYSEPSTSVATVGRVLQVSLSSSDDLQLGRKVKVLKVGSDLSPTWLHWDPKTRTLQGLPLDEDKGLHDLRLTSADGSSDVFLSLEVLDEEQLLQEDQPDSCGPQEPLTLLTVVLDADLTKMSSHQRVALLDTMRAFSGVDLQDMKVQPVVNNRLFDMSAFVAGPGNARKVVENGALLSWKLGCSLDQTSVPDLGAVGGPARSGSMATLLGFPVVGWHVANRWREAASRRSRRQLTVGGPTPVLTAVPPPTSLVQPPVRVVPNLVLSSPVAASPPTSIIVPPARGPAPPLPGRQTSLSKTRNPSGQTPTLVPPPPTSLVPPATSTDFPTIRPTATRPTYTEATPTPPGPTPSRRPTRKPKRPKTTTPGPHRHTTAVPPHDPSNSPPRLMNPVDEVAALVGTYFEVKVPLDTFFDREDGTADKLRLTLRRQGRNRDPVAPDSWIQLDPARQLIYGLPDPHHVGRHEFFLQAADRGGQTAVDALEVRVVAWPSDDPGPALFWARLEEGEVAPDPRRPPLRDPRRKVALVRKLAAAMGDRNASNVSLRNISQGSVLVEWSNSSLLQGAQRPRAGSGHCPREQLLTLSTLLSQDLQGEPSDNFRSALQPDYRPIEVGVRGRGPCQGLSFVPLRDLDAAPPSSGGAAATPPPHQRSSGGEQAYLHTVVPAAVVGAALLVGGLLALCCYRRRRQGRLSLEEQAAFVKKGVPIIFAHEMDRAPPSSSYSATAPLVLPEEKPPLAPPPEYPATPPSPAQVTPSHFRQGGEGEPDAPPYQPPPPFASTGPPPLEGAVSSRPRNMTPYRAPPPYVPP